MIKRSTYVYGLTVLCLIAVIFLCMMIECRKAGSKLCINELLASSYLIDVEEADETSEWIELYNGSEEDICLNGYGLSNNVDDPFKWVFPDVELKRGEFLLVYAGSSSVQISSDQELHTNFYLNSRGGSVLLTAPDGTRVDQFDYQTCYTNISYGRKPDGGKTALLNEMTPGTSNYSNVSRYTADIYTGGLPEFSHKGGFYEEPFFLTITYEEDETVYYTLDGSEPDFSSMVYTEPILIEDRSMEPNQYACINTSYSSNILHAYGQEPVKKGTVVRARICRSGHFSREIQSATFFVGQKQELTTVSVIADPEDLFGYEDGIYVGGKLLGYFTHTSYNEYYGEHRKLGNYSINGEAARRPAHYEIFWNDASGQEVSQMGEISLTGGLGSAAAPAKSFCLYATLKYSRQSSIEVPAFPYTETSKTKFRQLVLRTSTEYITEGLEDAFVTTCFLGEGLGVQAYMPVSVYINGEYWGVAEMRERLDEALIADHFGIDPDQIVLLKSATSEDRTTEKMVIKSGTQQDREDYLELFTYVQNHDMSREESYEYLCSQIDMNSLIRAYLAHIFFANRDWPDNNIRVFRTATVDDSLEYADGRWRFLLFDMDYSCEDYTHNTLLYAMGEVGREYESWGDNQWAAEWSTALFAGLMDNPQFRAQFLNQYREYRKELFQPEFLKNRLETLIKEYGSELACHSERWTSQLTRLGRVCSLVTGRQIEENGEDMEEIIGRMRMFCEHRLTYMDQYMEEFYRRKGEDISWE